jgi:hypothetical protein
LPYFFFGVNHARDRSWHAYRFVANLAGAFDHVALRVEIHAGLRGRRGFFAIVDKMRLAIGHADQHEAAAAQISRGRMHHGQRESRSHRGIHGIAARLHDLNPSLRSQVARADHDRVLRMDRVIRSVRGQRIRGYRRQQQPYP